MASEARRDARLVIQTQHAAQIEMLRFRLKMLKDNPPGDGWSFAHVGNWLTDIGRINLEIAELLLSNRTSDHQ